MHFDKKKRGRKKGSITTGYIHKTAEEKGNYHGDAVKQHRQSKAEVSTPATTSTVTDNEACSSSNRGRKPLRDTPMTPNTMKRRRVET